MKENIKICVIGSGRWGLNHITTLNTLGNLGGIVDINENRLTDLSNQYKDIKCFNNIDKAIAFNFDGYIVATPAETHYSISKKLLNHGKNILIEKPMALLESESKELVNLSKKNECTLLVGHQLLFHPAIIKIRELISSKKIGKLLYISSSRQNLGTVRQKEDVIWSFAPHDISLINYLIDDIPISINASAGSFLQSGIFDKANISFTYPNDIKGYIYVSWLHPVKEQKLIVVGDKGIITFDDASENKNIILNKKWIDTSGNVPIAKNDGIEIIEYKYSLPLENELKHFINLIQKLSNSENGVIGYEVIKILNKISKDLSSHKED